MSGGSLRAESGREGGGGKGGGGEGGGGEGGGGEGGGEGGGSEGGGCEGGGRWACESMCARRGRGAARVRARAAGAHRFQMGRPRYMKIGTSAVHGMHTGPMQMKGIAWHSRAGRALLATSVAPSPNGSARGGEYNSLA